MKALFKSDELQRKFEKNGFVKVKLLSDRAVKQLMNEYEKVAAAHEEINIPYITTSHSNNPDLIKHVDGVLQRIIAPELANLFTEYKLLFGNFLVKMPGVESETEPHQDITFVDETTFVSVNIWVALQDTTPENGCMYFLKSSHNLMPTIRPTHDYLWPYEEVKQEIKKLSTAYPAKAGEAFIFNHAAIHGSFANSSHKPRIACVIAAYNADAPLIHYFLPDKKNNQLQKYSMDKEAYLHFVKHQPPTMGVFIENKEFEFHQLSKTEFLSSYNKVNNQNSLLNRFINTLKRKQRYE